MRTVCGLLSLVIAAGMFVLPACGGDGSGSPDEDSDTGPVVCTGETWDEDFFIHDAEDVATVAPYKRVNGKLDIGATSLTTLELPCLESVGGELHIGTNSALTSFDMSVLASVGEDLYIGDNDALTSLEGLGALTSVGGVISIRSNDALTSLDGLDSLTSVGDDVSIYANDALTSLEGLSALTSVWGLYVDGNLALPYCEICSVLDQLDSPPTDIFVENNLVDSCYLDEVLTCP